MTPTRLALSGRSLARVLTACRTALRALAAPIGAHASDPAAAWTTLDETAAFLAAEPPADGEVTADAALRFTLPDGQVEIALPDPPRAPLRLNLLDGVLAGASCAGERGELIFVRRQAEGWTVNVGTDAPSRRVILADGVVRDASAAALRKRDPRVTPAELLDPAGTLSRPPHPAPRFDLAAADRLQELKSKDLGLLSDLDRALENVNVWAAGIRAWKEALAEEKRAPAASAKAAPAAAGRDRFCRACGAELRSEVNFCTRCGAKRSR